MPAAPERKRSVGRPAGQTAAHVDKRITILRTAAQLFAANGFEATSLA
jgi:AcrR family transcriptional regulator